MKPPVSYRCRALATRVARLEATTHAAEQVRLRIGYLPTLPENFVGQRHVIILSRHRTGDGIETCLCEERPGPAPAGTETPNCHVFLNEDDQKL